MIDRLDKVYVLDNDRLKLFVREARMLADTEDGYILIIQTGKKYKVVTYAHTHVFSTEEWATEFLTEQQQKVKYVNSLCLPDPQAPPIPP